LSAKVLSAPTHYGEAHRRLSAHQLPAANTGPRQTQALKTRKAYKQKCLASQRWTTRRGRSLRPKRRPSSSAVMSCTLEAQTDGG